MASWLVTYLQRNPRWQIYALKDPHTGEVRYVGCTTHMEQRFRAHLGTGKAKQHTGKARWIRRLRRQGLRPIWDVLESGRGPSWIAAEIRWISHYRTARAKLFNRSTGGPGAAGRRLSRAHVAALRKANLGKSCPPETRSKIRAALTGRPLSPDARAHVIAGIKRVWRDLTPQQRLHRLGRRKPLSPETRAKISAALTGTLRSVETRRKIAAAVKKQFRDPVTGRFAASFTKKENYEPSLTI